jgi:hypothetical protein
MFATNLLIHIPFINFSSMAIVGMFRKLRGSDGEFECVSNFKVYQDYSIEDGVKGGKKSSRFSMGIHCVSSKKSKYKGSKLYMQRISTSPSNKK